MTVEPGYLRLLKSGELDRRAKSALKLLESRTLCPHKCNVDRSKDQKGFCKIGKDAIIASYGPHFGEEAPISGQRGSGTVFFSGCNLKCVYCQNFEISQKLEGYQVPAEYLAFVFLALQNDGCHNINLVTPTHIVPQFLEALVIAAKEGLHIPIVYNCGGYESIETLKLLDGIIDIYMPDLKYGSNSVAHKYSKIKGYWDIARDAIKEMHRQVGDLRLDSKGIAQKGLLIRHLVLPNDLDRAAKVLEFIAKELSTETYVNIMDQYRPCGMAHEFPELNRRITREEYMRAVEIARAFGLNRLD